MKKIQQTQIDFVMNLLRTYNVGIQDYIKVQQMFEQLPVIENAAETPVKVEEPKVEEMAAPKVEAPKK